ncbi:MAG: DsbA family protein [Dongiaceae bacterium]
MVQRREALGWLACGAGLGGLALVAAPARAGGLARLQIADSAPAPELRPDDMVLGKADAPVTVIEYASLTCPHCAHFATTTFPKVKSELIDTGKLRWVYRDFPLNQVDVKAFALAHCVPKEQFFPMIGVLYESQNDWLGAQDPVKALQQIGRTAGLDQAAIDQCFGDKTFVDKLVAGLQDASTRYKVESTPTFVIAGKAYPGAMEYDAFYELIKDQLPKS